MKRSRLSLAALSAVGMLALALLAPCRADPGAAVNVDALAGIWRMVKTNGKDVPAQTNMLLQLTRDGKVVASMFEHGKSDSRSGVWKLNGSRLTIQMQGEPAETESIKTLDDSKMTTVDSQGQESVLRKLK